MLPIIINVLLVIHVLVSLLIILLVLMQRPKNEGLGAAFGGGMTENLFGAQTTNVLQTITRWLGGIFFALTLLLSYLYVKQTHQGSSIQRELSRRTVIPAATPAPALPPGPSTASPPVKPETSPLEKETAPTPGATTPSTTPPPATPAPASPVQPAPDAAPAPADKPAENKAGDSPAPAPAPSNADATKPAAGNEAAPPPANPPTGADQTKKDTPP